ncbi:hypothetical protein [Stenotrophomonas sp.]|uniref:hypothetical protein n=1 Tax=Stenotrophomonas sp. TaxID=69392 RepID=UPI0028A6D9D1|nr:hypothetical protein [Stenotrophomonas sp.]
MSRPSLPPVPIKLREMLALYPDLIERLQDVLLYSAERSRKIRLMPFDDAVSMLEGQLEEFISDARTDLSMAEASKDDSAIDLARQKELAVSMARQKRHWITDEALANYFGKDFS